MHQTLDDHGNSLDSFRLSLESFRSFRGPLRLKPVTGQELFFAVSRNKPALTNFGVHESLKLHNITVGLVQVFTKLHKLKCVLWKPALIVHLKKMKYQWIK